MKRDRMTSEERAVLDREVWAWISQETNAMGEKVGTFTVGDRHNPRLIEWIEARIPKVAEVVVRPTYRGSEMTSGVMRGVLDRLASKGFLEARTHLGRGGGLIWVTPDRDRHLARIDIERRISQKVHRIVQAEALEVLQRNGFLISGGSMIRGLEGFFDSSENERVRQIAIEAVLEDLDDEMIDKAVEAGLDVLRQAEEAS